MGYYTQYDIKISGISNSDEAERILQEYNLEDYDVLHHGTEIIANFNAKWYDWKKETVSVSKNYPQIFIEISATGEEAGDIWKARARNGICEVVNAKIVFDDFKVVI